LNASVGRYGSHRRIFVVWLACALLLFVLERFAAADNSGLWESDHPVESVLAYLILFLAGPLIVAGFLLWIAGSSWVGSGKVRPSPRRKTHPVPETEDSVLVDLVRCRAAPFYGVHSYFRPGQTISRDDDCSEPGHISSNWNIWRCTRGALPQLMVVL
jgi:hypothetical protein